MTYLALQADPATHLVTRNTLVGVGVEGLTRGLMFELTIVIGISLSKNYRMFHDYLPDRPRTAIYCKMNI